jgi:hypothetical protein
LAAAVQLDGDRRKSLQLGFGPFGWVLSNGQNLMGFASGSIQDTSRPSVFKKAINVGNASLILRNGFAFEAV